MTNDEAVKVIESEHVWLPRTYGWRKVEDAHEMAIKALQDQAKYEKALSLASTCIQSQDICPCEDCLILSELEDDDEPQCYEEGCGIRLSEYFKRKAGLEAD